MLLLEVKEFLDYKAVERAEYKVLRKLHDQIKKLWRDSVRAFIKEAISTLYLHIDTGMSIASLIPLATEVTFQQAISEALAGKGYIGKPYYDWGGRTDYYKSPSYGEELGKTAYDLEWGSPRNPTLVFKFHIVVFQYWLHEHGYAINSDGAWNTLRAGQAAFDSFWNRHHEEYVDLNKIMNEFLPKHWRFV